MSDARRLHRHAAPQAPYAAAARELGEEIGLRVRPGLLLVTDWVPPRPDRTEGLMLAFDGGVLAPSYPEYGSPVD